MSAWNRNPSAYANKTIPVPATGVAIKAVIVQSSYALLSASSARFSGWIAAVLALLLPPSLALSTELVHVLCWLSSAVFAIRAANTFARWQSTRLASVEQAGLKDAQRRLMGLGPAAAKIETPATQRRLDLGMPALPGTLGMLLTPPMRGGLPVTSAARDAATPLGAPSRPSPGFDASPAPSAIATPEQLAQFLDSLSSRMAQQQLPTGAGMGAPADAWHLPGGYAAAGQLPPGFLGAGDQDQASAMFMPVGVDAPKYRPSWLPRAKTIVHAPDVLSPSSPDEVEETLRNVLMVEHPSLWLEVWVENLREWMSRVMMRPLLLSIEGAHSEVNAVLQQYNQQMRLPPLPDVVGSENTVDIESCCDTHRNSMSTSASFCQALGAQGPGHLAPCMALARGLVRYDQLLLLLRGKLPPDLLPPVPPGYVWSRIQALAEGTCLPAYQWAGGGSWAGRHWSPDLPNDTAVVLYLFAAFIEAPGWEFPLQRQTGAQKGMPLFLGQLQTRPPNQYSAILAYRPDAPGPRVDAILALNLASNTGPMMCFLADGRFTALTGYHALFHVIIMFILYHKLRYNSVLGNHYLHDPAVDLAVVVDPPSAGSSTVRNQSVFGWWYPPTEAQAAERGGAVGAQ
ncbi:hypothetical protein FOA52_013743 [Chlamydomonas sp. UWO 241]|nr:hypothetical protein FOA52_013743 [Chlamydomonas sp. UWO 241]